MAAAKSRGTRRLAIIVLAVVAVIGAIAVAVPFLISSDTVRKRISDQITHWTGRTFTFSGDAVLRLFPYLTVRLQDASIANPAGMGGEPFISAGVMTGKLEILPLLRGRLEFAEFRIVKPTINLAVDSAGEPNWILDQGVVGTLAAKGDSELPVDDPAPPTPRAEVSLGRLMIRGGTVNFSDARNGANETLSEVNADFTWRTTIEALRGSGSFAWRGEPVAFRGEINTPLTLLAGGDSPLRVSVEAAPAKLSFEGMARQFDGMQIEGMASLKLPSVARFAEWTGAAVVETSLVRAASLAGRVSWAAATLNLGQLAIDLDGNAGEGALTATMVGGRPSLQGTLDFARFDMTPHLTAFAAAVDADGAWRQEPIRLPLAAAANLDLRLSAGQAVAGATEVGPVATSLLVKDGRMLVEIGEAHLGEGTLEASLRAEIADGGLSGAASLKADALAAETAAGLLGLSGLTGTGDATVDVAASGATWGDLVAGLSGSAAVTLMDGAVTGIDLAALPRMIADPAANPTSGATSFSRAAATLTIADGTLSTDDLRVDGPGYALNLAGKAVLGGDAVEARGVLTLLGDPPGEVPFLLNGTWGEPKLRPDLGGPLPRDDSGRADSPLPTDG